MQQNRLDVPGLLRRLVVSEQKEGGESHTGNVVGVEFFGRFLKKKIDKKRDAGELMRFAHMMDVDQDSYIDQYDLQTCLGNINNDTFMANNGHNLAMTTGMSELSSPLGTTDASWFPKKKMDLTKAAQVVKQIKDSLI